MLIYAGIISRIYILAAPRVDCAAGMSVSNSLAQVGNKFCSIKAQSKPHLRHSSYAKSHDSVSRQKLFSRSNVCFVSLRVSNDTSTSVGTSSKSVLSLVKRQSHCGKTTVIVCSVPFSVCLNLSQLKTRRSFCTSTVLVIPVVLQILGFRVLCLE